MVRAASAYTLAKLGMSFCELGLAEEFGAERHRRQCAVAADVIATDALDMIPGSDNRALRKPEIVADAAHAVLVRAAARRTGRFLIDEDVLREAGVTDFSRYAVDPARQPLPDLFL